MNQVVSITCGCLVGLLLFLPASAQELSEQEFQSLHQQLRPDPDESWRTIPWKISLLEAQRLGAEQNKPVFIWAMDGHPLGCT